MIRTCNNLFAKRQTLFDKGVTFRSIFKTCLAGLCQKLPSQLACQVHALLGQLSHGTVTSGPRCGMLSLARLYHFVR